MKRILSVVAAVALAGILCVPVLTGAVPPLPSSMMKASKRFAWQQPIPQGNPVKAVDFISDQTGWAIGDGGTVLKTTDGCATWESLGPVMPWGPSPRKTKVWDIEFVDADHGWVATEGMVYRTTDGGVTWSDAGVAALDPAGALRNTSVDFADADTGWWVGGGRMFHSSDGGATAIEQTLPVGAVIDTVEVADTTHAYAYRYSAAGYLVTSDGGATWEQQYFTGTAHEGKGPWSFAASSESTAYAVADGDVLKTTDEGSTWTTQTVTSLDPGDISWLVLTSDDDPDGSQLYIITDGNDLHASSDGGATWVKKFDHVGLAGIDVPTTTSLFVVDPTRRVAFSTNSGETWMGAYGKNTADTYTVVDFTSETTGYAATPWSLASTSDGGLHWRVLDPANEGIGLNQIMDVTFLDAKPELGWMVGAPPVGQPLVYKTTDAGMTWVSQEETTMADVRQMRFSDEQNGWAIDAYQNGYWHSSDGGNTWSLVPHAGSHWDMDWADADNGWIAFQPMSGGDLALAHTADGGSTWTTQTIPGSAGIMQIDFADNTQAGYAFDSTGNIYKTTNGGETWSVIDFPSIAPDVRLSDIKFTTELDGWVVGAQYTPAGPGTDVRHDFAAHTTDGGMTWDVTDPDADMGATGTSVGIGALDVVNDQMWMVGSYGSILKYRHAPVVTMSSTSKTLTAYNQTTALTGVLTDNGQRMVGRKVEVWTSSSAGGTPMKTSSSAITAADGTFSVAVRPSSTTYYRLKFAGDAMTKASSLSSYVKIVPKPYVGNPVAPARMTRSTYYTAYGYLKPRHTAGTTPVRIYMEHYVSGSWRRVGYVKATASNYSNYSKYSARVRLTASGRWRLRAYHPADSGQTAAWSSGYDYVTVP